jgi:hypothetical protein
MTMDDWLWLAVGAAGLAVTVMELVRRRAAGAVLLDLGRRAGLVHSLVVGVLFVALFLTKMFVSHERTWVTVFAFFGWNCGFLAAATRRLQLRKAGVFGRRYRLIRWETIEGCALSPIGGLSVKLRDKGWIFVCDVHADRRTELEELLASKCPAAAKDQS